MVPLNYAHKMNLTGKQGRSAWYLETALTGDNSKKLKSVP